MTEGVGLIIFVVWGVFCCSVWKRCAGGGLAGVDWELLAIDPSREWVDMKLCLVLYGWIWDLQEWRAREAGGES